ncbi:phosphatase PAP2 family protein [Candidatus Woesearchaeota archaeon]|nr:phosphatase PAP2 family protein [Candidatus Woesearchaeota archaeon]
MSLLSIEIFIIKLFQLYQPSWLTSIMLFISLISSIGSYFIIVPIVALFFSFKNYKTEAFFSIFINLGNILNPIIKNIAGRSRPNSGLIKILEEKTSMSFPSGHAMGAIIFYGFLIYLIWKLPFKHKKIIIPLLLLFILLVGISRIYLGAHWPTDVLAGYVIGFIWLICGIFIYSKFRKVFIR